MTEDLPDPHAHSFEITSSHLPKVHDLKQYIVRGGHFTGRKLLELKDDELNQMIDEIPHQDPNVTAGVRMMKYILRKGGGKKLIEFVEWGQNVIDETGEIGRADFIPDPDEAPMTDDEKQMLKSARPRMLNRRTLLLGAPSALIAVFTTTKLTLSGAAALFEDQKNEEAVNRAHPKQEGALTRISEKLNRISSTPVELLGMATLLYEILDMIKEYEPQQMFEISNAVSELAHNMGMGDPIHTFRLGGKATDQSR